VLVTPLEHLPVVAATRTGEGLSSAN
jgi:hypothetical protein